MTQKLQALLLLTVATLLSPLARAENGPIDRIEAACQKTLKPDAEPAKVGKVCGCVRKNYEAKGLKEDELELMARSHEEDPKAEEELQKDQWEELVLFDYDVTDGCMKKPTFRYR